MDSRFVVQCEDMIYTVSQKLLGTYTAFIWNIPHTDLSHIFANKCIYISTWGPLLMLVVTRVSTRNVLWYGLSEYA